MGGISGVGIRGGGGERGWGNGMSHFTYFLGVVLQNLRRGVV
jgi:hypothetical protein